MGFYVVIGEKVKVGVGIIIGVNVVIEGLIEIGFGNWIFFGVVIGLEL